MKTKTKQKKIEVNSLKMLYPSAHPFQENSDCDFRIPSFAEKLGNPIRSECKSLLSRRKLGNPIRSECILELEYMTCSIHRPIIGPGIKSLVVDKETWKAK